ncbi:hypothetical protein KC332_g14776 [Hortaea werneckii]|uniref:Swiss Army Knife RNA repair protein HAD domain-containing protein n=1 Tax=Hortaea werneckii TaxID=91943 RepID=A0A3M7IFU4_HORWE|nr:hypothetical protein KC350_g17877 [Hortaea werneckii]KAI6803412.1 hypothetical protein KC358_g14942 [Hortaea werneckii]KAI6905693.1 hypothetical protein KC348_g14909 [Hortaea werneckii]KAI6923445.1 hypothetical protein KC341_g14736 [Hortaea werneckii]KAI6956888.1 hypothetical protein KC321_g14900 [Hortaea werneckii]
MDRTATFTPTALKRWSCIDKDLPKPASTNEIAVFDFDNTLFSSPLPNKQIWNVSTCGQLQAQDFLHNGGWWHNPRILAATGQGLATEEQRAWEGYWNERIVELVRIASAAEDTLTVLLTGRMESAFSDLLIRMVKAKGLDFDMICLKPSVSPNGELFPSTMHFKQALLRDIVFTYPTAREIRMYEDRPKHTKGFRDFFTDLNKAILMQLYDSYPEREPITAEVIQVSEQETTMEPVNEVSEVQQMLNVHNDAVRNRDSQLQASVAVPYKIKRSVFYTGYIIQQADTEKLKSLVKLPPNCPEHEVRLLANNILITPRPAPPSILDKVGGIGAKMSWRVTGLACYENRVWAACVQPIPSNARIYTENFTPCVVLATRRQSKPIEASRIQNWQPVPDNQAFEFETTVGEKVLLRIEEEMRHEDSYEASFPNAKNARKHPREEDFPPLGKSKPQRNFSQENRQAYGGGAGSWAGRAGGASGSSAFASQRGGGGGGGGGGRGGRGGHRGFRGGGGRGGSAGGRGGRGRGGYRSLDDSVGQGYGGGGMQY